MATISEAFSIAIQHHQAGQLQLAEQIYRQIIEVQPDNGDALHLLGVINAQTGNHQLAVEYIRRALQVNPDWADAQANLGSALWEQGKPDEALPFLQRAVQLKPDSADAHNSLGTVLASQGKADEAIACYRQALKLRPNYAEALGNLGNALRKQRKLDEAVPLLQRAVQLKPHSFEGHSNLGNAFQDQGKLGEAVACYGRVLELKPEYPEAHFNLGNALKDQGRLAEAIGCYRRAIELKPDYAEAHSNLGTVLADLGRLEEAVACYRQAVALSPGFAEAHTNLGNALREQGKLDEAVECYGRALGLKPALAGAHNNLGTALMDQGRRDAAIACYRRAVELQPGYADAHHHLGMACLLTGNLPEGWSEYEWRWRCPKWKVRNYHRPAWDGQSLAGKTILLYGEQGLGDLLQFVRYAALVKKLGARTIVECYEPLVELIGRSPGVDLVVAPGWPLPEFDLHLPLMSLPRLLQTTLETVPAEIPYLFADPDRERHWRDALSSLAGLKVGISWQGSPTHRGDRFRSVPLSFFEPLSRCRDVSLVSLQKGPATEQLAEAVPHFTVLDLGAGVETIPETAAVIKNLDLVITVDTAIAHLAGGLGMPTWVLLPFAPDWRWLLERDDSPWYPTLRLFRQRRIGDWGDVQERLLSALQNPRPGR